MSYPTPHPPLGATPPPSPAYPPQSYTEPAQQSTATRYEDPTAAPAPDDAALRLGYHDHLLVVAFPQPPHRVIDALAKLRLAANGTDEQKKQAGPLHTLPRPWIPASCPPPLRRAVWGWLEQVAVWHNHEYVWPAERAIPACWPWHPPITHELAVLAFLRLQAESSPEPAALEEWHRHSRPQFVDRLHTQLGPNGCAKEHQHWPGAPRWHRHTGTVEHSRRSARFDADSADTTADAGAGQVPPWVDPVTGLVDEAGYAATHPTTDTRGGTDRTDTPRAATAAAPEDVDAFGNDGAPHTRWDEA